MWVPEVPTRGEIEAMRQYVGLDVSLAGTAICVVDAGNENLARMLCFST